MTSRNESTGEMEEPWGRLSQLGAAILRIGASLASQSLANRLIESDYTGIRVQSFGPGAGTDELNLVFWRWGNNRPSRIVLIDDEEHLPKDSF